MRLLMASLLTGIALAGAPLPSFAQEVAVEKAALTKVVIAPPRSDLARIIKAGLQKSYYEAERGTRAYTQAQKLYFFYGERGFEPLWLTPGVGSAITFSENATKILAVFEESELEGFRPSDYLTPDLNPSAAGTDPAKLAALETAFSQAAIRYAQDAFGGRITPTDVSSNFVIAPKRIDEAETLLQLASSDEPDQFLRGIGPKHPEFLRLKGALAKFYDGSVTVEQVTIPDGAVLKLGMEDERVPLLRQRLGVAAPDIPEGATDAVVDFTYDQALLDAVKAFQEELGLAVDGVLGPATIAALNGGGNVSRDDIIANMERWRWEPEDMGDFNVQVNIPEFTLWIKRDGESVFSTRVVVGTEKNQTPIFSDNIRHIVVNPYWNVPPSIAAGEIRPNLIANPNYLDSQNMELLSGGKVVSAAGIDWATTNINRYSVRQRPGPNNALGRVKFLFPNSHNIYLHDTPAKSLFSRAFRAYSHGCVRVQNPFDFAEALVATNPNITRASLEGLFGPNERWVNMQSHVPVHLMYFTLRIDEDGTLRNYGDVYGHNKKLIQLLNAE